MQPVRSVTLRRGPRSIPRACRPSKGSDDDDDDGVTWDVLGGGGKMGVNPYPLTEVCANLPPTCRGFASSVCKCACALLSPALFPSCRHQMACQKLVIPRFQTGCTVESDGVCSCSANDAFSTLLRGDDERRDTVRHIDWLTHHHPRRQDCRSGWLARFQAAQTDSARLPRPIPRPGQFQKG